jgi:3',5'-cyclic AMP phosphodiesterase CpdA
MIIAQITDLHAGRRVETPAGALDTFAALERAVAHLNALRPAPDVVLATGDLSHDTGPEAYLRLKDALAPLAMPLYVIPGNHDDRENLRAAFAGDGYLPAEGGFLHYAVEGYPLRLIALDTAVAGEERGELCAERLAWFEARLEEAPERPTVVFMHHPPFETGIPFFDRIGCRGGAAMGAIVQRHPQIEAVLCGHVHRAIALGWHGTVVQVTPSTGYQYPLDLIEAEGIAPVLEPPACRVCLWRPGVGLVSHLSFIGGHGGA